MRLSVAAIACACLSFTSVFIIRPEIGWAGVFSDGPSYGSTEVEFFAAIDAEQIEATMVPNDSRKVTIQVKNNTDKPLAIRLPHAFAGVPVLAQLGLPNIGGNGGGAPQGLGMGFPGGGGGNNAGGIFGRPGGVMNIPPGKVLKVKRASVCLEYGKPEPGPRIPYKIVPLEEMSDDPSLREMLTVLGHGELNQRIAQIVAWRFANGMTWEQLASLTVKQFNGRHTPRFTLAEIRLAQQLAAALPSQQRNRNDQQESLSRR